MSQLRDRHHEVASAIADETLDVPFVVAFAGTAIAIPYQVVGQEAAEQCCALACPIGEDLRNKAAIVVVDNRLWHRSEERERMDVTIDPGLSYRRRIGPHIAAVAMRQIQYEEVRFPLHAADHHHRLAEIGLSVPRRMSQRHEHLLAALIPLTHVILDDRVAASEAALVPEPVEHTFGRMALLARHLHILIQPLIDYRDERIQLGSPDRQLTLITGRCRIRHHLANAVARYVEMLRSLTPGHPFRDGQANLEI
jgi:hypothetical protein